MVEQKQTEADAIVLFNDSFKKGIRLLIDLGVVQENPESIAFYMHECKQLDKVFFFFLFSFFFFLSLVLFLFPFFLFFLFFSLNMEIILNFFLLFW